MKPGLRYILLLLLFIFFSNHLLFGQASGVDSNYIYFFNKKNVIEIYPGVYSTKFKFSTAHDRKNNYSLVANSSGYIGLYMSYKWMSLKYSWGIPGTELAKHVRLQSTSLGLSFRIRRIIFRPFYNSYKG